MSITIKQKELLKEFVSYRCEICNKKENELNKLVIHHIHRKVMEGKDNLQNLKVICENCHKLLHSNEFK